MKRWRDLVDLWGHFQTYMDWPDLRPVWLVWQAARAVSLECYKTDDGHYLPGASGRLFNLVLNTSFGNTFSLFKFYWERIFTLRHRFGLGYEFFPLDSFSADWVDFVDAALPNRSWDYFYEAMDRVATQPDSVSQTFELLVPYLPAEMDTAIFHLNQAIDLLAGRVAEEFAEIAHRLDRASRFIDPMNSQFANYQDPENPFIPFRMGFGYGQTVIPNPTEADIIINSEELKVPLNLVDIICFSTQVILAYLGADKLPRPWFPSDSEASEAPYQLNNLADCLGQLHAEFREANLVNTEIRVGPQGDQTEEIRTNIGTALGLLLSAVRDLSLDSERTVALSAQAAQASLSSLAAAGVKTVPGEINLGFRGKVPAVYTTGASLAQQLGNIEVLLNLIALQLGVSLEPRQGN